MELRNISFNLRQPIQQNQVKTLDLSPIQIAEFLDICRRSLCEYICHANEQLGADSEAYIPAKELESINSVFIELSNNFFPMAHSTSPLRDLQIVDKPDFLDIKRNLEYMKNISNTANEISKHLSDSIQRLINP